MQKIILGACTLMSLSVFADEEIHHFSENGLEQTGPLQAQACGRHSLLLQNGDWLCGELSKVPSLNFSFGKVSLDVDKVVALSFSPQDKKMTILTNKGLQYSGPIPVEPLNFIEFSQGDDASKRVVRELNPDEIKYVLLDQNADRSYLLRDKGFNLQFKNGDRIPVVLSREPIHVSDGWKARTLKPETILELSFNGGLHGYIDHKGTPEAIDFSFVSDKYLNVHIPETQLTLRLPWTQISSIQKSDRLENYLLQSDSVEHVSKQNEKRVLGTAIAAVGEKVKTEDNVAYQMLPADALDPNELETHPSGSNSQNTNNEPPSSSPDPTVTPDFLSHAALHAASHRVAQRLFDPMDSFEALSVVFDKDSGINTPEELEKREDLAYEDIDLNSSKITHEETDNVETDSTTDKIQFSNLEKSHTPSDNANGLGIAETNIGHRVPERRFDPEEEFEALADVSFEEANKGALENPSKAHSFAIVPNIAMHENKAIADIAYEENAKTPVLAENTVHDNLEPDPDPGPGIVDIVKEMMAADIQKNQPAKQSSYHFDEKEDDDDLSEYVDNDEEFEDRFDDEDDELEAALNEDIDDPDDFDSIREYYHHHEAKNPIADNEDIDHEERTKSLDGRTITPPTTLPAPPVPETDKDNTNNPSSDKEQEDQMPEDKGSESRGSVQEQKSEDTETNKLNMVYVPSMDHEIKGYYIDKHKVTNEEYKNFIKATNYHHPSHWTDGQIPPGQENQPVVNVSYVDALVYAVWNGKRIPTEEEWKDAAFKVNAFSDLHSPVKEWTATTYIADRSSEQLNKQGADNLMGQVLSNNYKIVVGGTDKADPPMHSEESNAHTGFRCAAD